MTTPDFDLIVKSRAIRMGLKGYEQPRPKVERWHSIEQMTAELANIITPGDGPKTALKTVAEVPGFQEDNAKVERVRQAILSACKDVWNNRDKNTVIELTFGHMILDVRVYLGYQACQVTVNHDLSFYVEPAHDLFLAEKGGQWTESMLPVVEYLGWFDLIPDKKAIVPQAEVTPKNTENWWEDLRQFDGNSAAFGNDVWRINPQCSIDAGVAHACEYMMAVNCKEPFSIILADKILVLSWNREKQNPFFHFCTGVFYAYDLKNGSWGNRSGWHQDFDGFCRAIGWGTDSESGQ